MKGVKSKISHDPIKGETRANTVFSGLGWSLQRYD